MSDLVSESRGIANRGDFDFRKFLSLALLWIIGSGCTCYTPTIVPIMKKYLRQECTLPLDRAEIRSTLKFIEIGGDWSKDDGFQPALGDSSFEDILEFFGAEDSANLSYGNFLSLPGLNRYFDLRRPVEDVFDARDSSNLSKKYAYRHLDFWFVFIVDSLADPSTGETVEENKRRLSRLIVMKAFNPKN